MISLVINCRILLCECLIAALLMYVFLCLFPPHFLLPLLQHFKGDANRDSTLAVGRATVEGPNDTAKWTQHIAGIHDTAQVGVAHGARGGQDGILLDVFMCFLGAA